MSQLVHFTTNLGMIGIFATRGIKSRARLPQEQYLEFVYKPNCVIRKDAAWIDYVNLSIEHINTQFFDIAAGKWHASMDGFWCIIACDPVLLTHDGVVFSTTNNMYSGTRRATGPAGLEALFAPRVHQFLSNYVDRPNGCRDSFPTCPQAEVLYPVEVPSSFIKRIIVAEDDHAAAVEAQCVAVGHQPVEVVVDPAAFRSRP